jgi:methyl-accepting chemotaxis protein
VNNAITSMDEVTQQNAALVEEAAAAAESLVDQAVGLMDTVSAFKLNNESAYGVNQHVSQSSKSGPIVRNSVVLKKPEVVSSAKLNGTTHDSDWEEF